MTAISNTDRRHLVYSGNNLMYEYITKDGYAITDGPCDVIKRTYNANGDILEEVRWRDNLWQASWNLAKTIV